mgnify:CR=1 FL=1
MSTQLREHADVSLERPARYGKQLAMHLSHKCEMSETSTGWELNIRDGRGIIIPGENVLTLDALAPSQESRAIVKDVLERHLRKFAAKLDPLTIYWGKN